jgi:hypothetical protein
MDREDRRHAMTLEADREKFVTDAQLRMQEGARSDGLEREKMATAERSQAEAARAKAEPQQVAAQQITAVAEGVQQLGEAVQQMRLAGRQAIAVTINALVSSAYAAADVEAQIRTTILDAYGVAAIGSRRGFNAPRYQEMYDLLRDAVPALAAGVADVKLDIAGCGCPDAVVPPPELWRYVTDASLTITVEVRNVALPNWRGPWGRAQ